MWKPKSVTQITTLANFNLKIVIIIERQLCIITCKINDYVYISFINLKKILGLFINEFGRDNNF